MRIRVGVGEKPRDWDLADYVLSRFSGEERAAVADAMTDAADAAELMIRGQADAAMNKYN